MLKLLFIYQSKELKTASSDNTSFVLARLLLKEFYSQMAMLLNFCLKAVKITMIMTEKTEVDLPKLYNLFLNCDTELLDSHRGSGRIKDYNQIVKAFC